MNDREGIKLKNGDIIDIGQTVNGQSEFVVMNLNPLDIRYNYDRLRDYEYDKLQLLGIGTGCYNEDNFIIIGNIKTE